MHAIVTKLALGKPLDDALIHKIETELLPRAREYPGFLEIRIVRVSDAEAILLAFFSSREQLDELSSKLAGPWFADNVRSYLAGPVQRSVGEVILSG